ncbi:hypothetical protein SNS2_4609 [Streptomyces netropsis]|uniref:Pimeloyl-ACP methyl ester carboxylesterase n=1 Tax=Streptomyces syringium TaxID=76729 RepID=A0ABS4Y0B3_9ACTN|nr:pimeloyl-ACP methyl ester carboxylesterase [Streptomyces syringium]SPE62995.1 hypothetical protein SNS2_4609 [Streptomyces netropsis]
MRSATVTADGDMIRWVELPGREPARVYAHGPGATSAPYFAEVAVHPALAGHRSLLIDLLGHGISDRPAVTVCENGSGTRSGNRGSRQVTR